MGVVQGRKPGWLLDKILGRKSEDETPAPVPPGAAEISAELSPAEVAEPMPEPPVLSPASIFEGQPDFTPAAEAGQIPAAPPSVTEPPLEAPREVQELAGATLQPGPDPDELAPASGQAAPEPAAAERTDAPGGLWRGLGFGRARDEATTPASSAAPAPAAAAPADPAGPEPGASATESRNWWRRLTDGMRRTSSSISDSVTSLFTKRKLDRAMLDDLEDVLIGADLGLQTATRITEAVAKGRYDREISPQEVKEVMAGEIEAVLGPVAQPLTVDTARRPFVLLMVGVNGAGKTTTIGKLAQKFRAQGHSVMIAAGDTFRAAAIEQLKVWGERTGAPVIARAQGSDAAGLAFDALKEARAAGTDILMIDTAGRLQNKAGLMAELEKIIRVMKKLDPEAPHACLLVLDATVGQNALSQVELFGKIAGVTGLVMTKLDGTARGGILVALAAKFGLPVHFIGVGEGVDDLEPFTARDFARAIAGLDEGGPTLH